MTTSHIKLETFRELSGVCQDFTAFERSQSRQWLRVEARVLEPETSIHAVRGELQRHLLDVILWLTGGSVMRNLTSTSRPHLKKLSG